MSSTAKPREASVYPRPEALLDTIDAIVWEVDAISGRCSYVSAHAERLLGYPLERWGREPEFWRQWVHVEDQERVAAARAEAVTQARSCVYECRARAADGRVLWVQERVLVVVEDGRLRWLRGLTIDATEWRRRHEQFEQTHRLALLGRLVGGVAHDLNNMIMALDGYSGVMTTHIDPAHPAWTHLQEVKRVGERAAALVRQLLGFARRRPAESIALDLNATVEGMVNMLKRLIGEDIRIVTCLSPDLGRIRADTAQVEQVLMNLAVNARDAMPTGGQLSVETCVVDADAAQTPGAPPRRWARLRVRDTGCGMPPEIVARIFQPFFTTKEEGKGTGLGLATVRDVVEHGGGVIRVESAPGQGTTFEIDWPMLDADNVAAETGAVAEEPSRGQETILLVEDDGALLRLLGTQLSGLGYTILQAAGGPEALLVAEAHPGAIDLVLTDVVMEEVNGRDVVALLTRSRPHIKSLYMSGHDDHVIVQQLRTHHPGALLEKPVGARDLARRVRLALNSS